MFGAMLASLVFTLHSAVLPSPDDALTAELDRLNRAELDALVRGDYAGAAAFYAVDALLLPPDGSVIRGRAAIESYWRALDGSSLSDVRTRVLSGGGGGATAFLAGEYSMSVQKAGGPATPSHGTFLLVFRRAGHRWEVIQDAWSSIPGRAAW